VRNFRKALNGRKSFDQAQNAISKSFIGITQNGATKDSMRQSKYTRMDMKKIIYTYGDVYSVLQRKVRPAEETDAREGTMKQMRLDRIHLPLPQGPPLAACEKVDDMSPRKLDQN
jgi:hypothetical protein